jgi:N-acetylneuraminate synthase
MNKFIRIRNRKIGYNYNPVVIAEIGINHGGSLKVAKKMVDLAAKAKVDIIKHQTHIVDDEMSKIAKKKVIKYIGKSIYGLMDSCALNESDELKLKIYVEKKGIIFLSTPFSRAAVDRLIKFNVPAFKIGSGECNNYPLIEYIASFKKPIILSTGMNDIPSIKQAVKIIENKRVPYALLHTTNIYPTPNHLVRLGAMKDLQKNFPKAVIGLSDHSTSNLACFGAVALGASILERHFTDNMNRKGPDIKNSMDVKAAKELVNGVKVLKEMRGGKKNSIKEENTVKNFAFASVVSIKAINKGEKLTKKNIWVKRPGTGPFLAKDFKKLLGKTILNNIDADTHIKKSDLS